MGKTGRATTPLSWPPPWRTCMTKRSWVLQILLDPVYRRTQWGTSIWRRMAGRRRRKLGWWRWPYFPTWIPEERCRLWLVRDVVGSLNKCFVHAFVFHFNAGFVAHVGLVDFWELNGWDVFAGFDRPMGISNPYPLSGFHIHKSISLSPLVPKGSVGSILCHLGRFFESDVIPRGVLVLQLPCYMWLVQITS